MNTMGQSAMALLDEAAAYSEPGPGVTRVLGSKEHLGLLTVMRTWFERAGARVELDGAGNLVGRWAGADPSARTLIIGSHQDTVRQGGAYDGIMGVVVPLVVMQAMYDEGHQPPGPVEIVAFSDEEGARFSSTLVGSTALAGTFDPDMLRATDRDGVPLEEALRDLGADPSDISQAARDPDRVSGFLELHIEQGPVLEHANLPVGIVTAITGIERHKVRIQGKAGHAGTTPMDLRQDALLAASYLVQTVNRLCTETDNLVGVVGELHVTPNAVNVIPSAVDLTIELRSPDSTLRRQKRQSLMTELNALMARLGVSWTTELSYEQAEVSCSPVIQAALAASVGREGLTSRYLFSGAGHDGLAMASLTDIGMLFMRCRDGLSHHPDESVTVDDMDVAARVIRDFIQHWSY